MKDPDWVEMTVLERMAALDMLRNTDGTSITLEEQYNKREVTKIKIETNDFGEEKEFRKFSMEERGKFAYWFEHWKAFQYTAMKLKVWKFKYLFHDIEKPWLMLLFKGDYTKVQKWHREHNRHHLEYKGKWKRDWEAMALDWQSSHLTKKGKGLSAVKEALRKYSIGQMTALEYGTFMNAAGKIGLER